MTRVAVTGAAGRMGKSEVALKALTEEKQSDVLKNSKKVKKLNIRRKKQSNDDFQKANDV